MAALLINMTSSHAPTRRKAGEAMTALLRNMTQNLWRDTTQISEVYEPCGTYHRKQSPYK